MADQKTSMASFVRRKEQATPVYDDLKEQVARPTANPAFSKPMHRNVPRQQPSAQPRTVQVPAQHPATGHNKQSSIFGVASSIGATSTTPDEAYAQPAYRAQPAAQRPAASPEQEDFMQDLDDDVMIVPAVVQNSDMVSSQQNTHLLTKSVNRQPSDLQQYATGISSKAIKGDSYPPTTSGLPSISDQNEAQREQVNSEKPEVVQQHATFQVRLPLPSQQRAKFTVPQPLSQPRPQIDTAGGQADSVNDSSPVVEAAMVVRQRQQKPVENISDNAHGHSEEMTIPHQPDVMTPPATIQRTSQPTAGDEQEEAPSRSQEEGLELDYSMDELVRMDFDQLQGEPFDRNTDGPDDLADSEQGDLGARLSQSWASKEPSELRDQQRVTLLHSLSIGEWDEAGEWFVEQFGTMVKRLQDARKKKRALSKEYEKAVANRHGQVVKRRKAVEDAMDTMRYQGQNLFTHTPQRTGK